MDRNIGVILTRIVHRVALRKESVDRNFGHEPFRPAFAGRSPQGERG